MKFDVGIMDECHYLMNKTSGRTKAILAKGGIIWSCDYKWALSGTLMKNRNRDCYAILRSLFPHVLGKYTEYRNYAEYFCGGRMGAFGYEDRLSTHTAELGEILSKIMIRRTKADVLSQLPELVEQNIYLENTPEIERVIKSETEFTEEDIKAVLNFEVMGKTATYRKELAMAKLPQAVEYIKEILNNVQKVTVFAYHRDLILEMAGKLSPYGVEVVMGGLTPEQKQQRVDNFVNNSDSRIFLGQIQAAGTGVDGLQLVCSDVVFAEVDWVPGTIDQARARCHRMGQKNSTHIHYLVVPNSLEEDMLNVLRNKRQNIRSVMKKVERLVETKGEKTMTIEATLERIAIALEKIAERKCDCKTIVEEPKAPAEPKKKSKAKAVDKTAQGLVEVIKEQVDLTPQAIPQTHQTEQIVEALEAEVAATPSVQKSEPVATPEVPAGDLQGVINECVSKAQELRAAVGTDAATVYINGLTAQITGVENARLRDCNFEQATSVLKAINEKLTLLRGDI